MKSIIFALFTVIFLSVCADNSFADFKWDLGGQVLTGYDDNITYVNTHQLSDMVTRTSIDGGFTQTGKNDVFDIMGVLTENIYTEHSKEDNFSQSLQANYKGDLSPYEHVTAHDSFSHSLDPSSLQNAFGRVNGSYETYYNGLDLESKTDITEQWSASGIYKQSNYIFSLNSLSDSTLYNPELSTEYDFSSQAHAMLNYDFRDRVFSPGASATANTPSVGWRQYLTEQLHVDLLTGVDIIKGFGESLVVPRYSAGITHDLDQNTQFSLTYDKQYEADSFTQNIINDWHVTLNGFHQFTARINGDLALFTGREGKYLELGSTYKFIGSNLTAKYLLNDHADITLTYGITESSSNLANLTSTHNTVMAGFAYKF